MRKRRNNTELFGTQKYVDRYNCGHPRTPENSTAKIRPQCRQCQKQKLRARRRQFRCGHPNTDENTVVHAGGSKRQNIRRCKTCYRSRPKTLRLIDLRQLIQVPRPLPIVDTSARSYALAPSRDTRGAA